MASTTGKIRTNTTNKYNFFLTPTLALGAIITHTHTYIHEPKYMFNRMKEINDNCALKYPRTIPKLYSKECKNSHRKWSWASYFQS